MMTNTQLAAASFNDIVFDGRNKGYGAYELRALYQRHVSRALVIGSSIFTLLIMFPLLAQYVKGATPVVAPDVVIAEPKIFDRPIDPVIEVIPPAPVKQVATARPAAQLKYTDFKVEKDNKVVDTPPDVAALATTQVGKTTIEGPDVAPLVDLPLVEGPKSVEGAAPTATPYTYVEQMPELPGGGGVTAIVAAIQKAVKYPPAAIRNGVEGRLYASFVVNAKGEVTDVKIVKGLGSGLDEESIRAINTLPRFIPGKQNGRDVSVQYTVPITYKIQ